MSPTIIQSNLLDSLSNNIPTYNNINNNNNNQYLSNSYNTNNNLLFKGLAYTPFASSGQCKSISELTQNIVTLSKYTNKLRLYANDCNQIASILQIIETKKLDLSLLIGIWTRDNQNIQQQANQIINLLKTNKNYLNKIIGVTVGNEDKFNGISTNNIINNLQFVKALFQKAGLNQIPISTVETGSNWDLQLAKASDIIYANIYSFFSNPPSQSTNNNPMQGAIDSIFQQIDALQSKLSKNITIGETGWPSDGTKATPSYAKASLSNQSQFIKGVLCGCKQRNLNYFWLEAFDSKWKKGDSTEKNFGVVLDDGKLKDPNLLSLSC